MGPGSEPTITITGAEWVDVDDIEDPERTPVMPIEYETDRETLREIPLKERQ